MNVGICIRLQDGLWQDQLRHATENGIRHCQLISWLPEYWNAETAEIIKREFAAHDMEITAFWCGWVGPRKWNFTEGPETLGIVPAAYRHIRMQNLLDGAAFARMSGSGTTVYGIFDSEETARACEKRMARPGLQTFCCHPVSAGYQILE